MNSAIGDGVSHAPSRSTTYPTTSGSGLAVHSRRASTPFSSVAVRVVGPGGCVEATGERAQQCADLSEANDDQARNEWIAAGGFIASGVGLIAGGLAFFLWPSRSSSATRMSLNGRGFQVSGQF